MLDLLAGNWDRAISRLGQALDLTPGDPRILIDASAAYLERGVRSGRPLDLLEALRLAQSAQARAPRSPEALFNFAQALRQLHLRRQEAKAWQRYLELEPRGGWAAEARQRLAEASDESFRQEREICRRQLLNGEIRADWLHRAVDLYPNEVREIAEEELLGRWAQAAHEGDRVTADRLMSRLSLIARQLAVQRGDWLLSDAVKILRSAARPGDSRRLERLIQAHLLFHRGIRSYRDQDFARAETLLDAAGADLHQAGSPLSETARFYHAICIYYSDAERARPLFVSLLDTLSQDRSPSLTGRTFWMLGTVDLVQGRFEEAIRSFTAMREPLERGAGEGMAAAAETLLAEASDLRGDVKLGWEHRLRGLRRLTVEGTLRRRHSVLFEAARALERRGQPETALLFLDEVLDNAALWRQPLATAEAYTLRSRVHLLLGRSEEALEDAHQALAAVSRMRENPLKARTQGQALMSQGMVLLKREARQALRDLRQAYTLERGSNWEVERILYLNSMARAHLALHQEPAARNFLDEAVQTYEAYRSDAMDQRSRISIFQHAQQSFDELMLLSWADPQGGPRQAFSVSERARARTLLDAWSLSADRGAARPADADRVLRELPSGVTLVQYAVLPEKLLIWVFENGTLQALRRELRPGELESTVRAFRRALQNPDAKLAREHGARLYDLLLRDLSLTLRPGNRLVIVPDGPLERIPFAALWDRSAQSYLIEKAPVSMAPSATLFLAAHRKTRRAQTSVKLLALAPDLTESPYAFLPRLPAAQKEVRQISALYPQATVLSGQEADSARFLQTLPEHSVLHFAGHAVLLDAESGRVFLLLAPSGDDRGEVSVASLRDLPLAHTDLVVLAACQTLNGYSPGREGALSIASAFFAAGAPTVVASLWEVNDRLSLAFMSRFHRRIAAGEDATSALRAVMIDFATSDDPEESSPSTWGVFAALGA